jgi:hypothetical protein
LQHTFHWLIHESIHISSLSLSCLAVVLFRGSQILANCALCSEEEIFDEKNRKLHSFSWSSRVTLFRCWHVPQVENTISYVHYFALFLNSRLFPCRTSQAKDPQIASCRAKPMEDKRMAVTGQEIRSYFHDLLQRWHFS